MRNSEEDRKTKLPVTVDKIRCHKCGKLGHKQAKCKSGGTSGSDAQSAAVADLANRAAGNAVAAKELAADLRDAETARNAAEASLALAEAELAVARANRAVEVVRALEGHSFQVTRKTDAFPLLQKLVFGGLVMAGVGFLFWGFVLVSSLLSVMLLVWACDVLVRDDEVDILCASFSAWLDDPETDMRHDAHSLQKLKHPLPLMSRWTLSREDEDVDRSVVISGELLLQLLSGHNLSYVAEPKIVHERLFRAACLNQSVNVPKSYIAASVHNCTALVAWVAWQSQNASKLLDFVNRPQQV